MEGKLSEDFVNSSLIAVDAKNYFYNPPPEDPKTNFIKHVSFRPPRLQSRRSIAYFSKCSGYGICGKSSNISFPGIGKMNGMKRKSSPKRTVPSHIVPPIARRPPKKIIPQIYSRRYKLQQQLKNKTNQPMSRFNSYIKPTSNHAGSTRPVTEASTPVRSFCSKISHADAEEEAELITKARNNKSNETGMLNPYLPSISSENYKTIIKSQKQIILSQEKIIDDIRYQLNVQTNYSSELKKLVVGKCEELRHSLSVNKCSCPKCGTEFPFPSHSVAQSVMETMPKEIVDDNNNFIPNIPNEVHFPDPKNFGSILKKQRIENWIKEQQELNNQRQSVTKRKLSCLKSPKTITSMSSTDYDFESLYNEPRKVFNKKEPYLNLLQELNELKIIDSATKGFLEELKARVNKARVIFDKYKQSIEKDIELSDPSNHLGTITRSLLKYVYWLGKFVDKSISDIEKFVPANERARKDPSNKYYFQTTVMIGNIERQGIFIPTPYCKDLFKSMGVQYEHEDWTTFILNQNRNAAVQCDQAIWNQFICQQVEEYQRVFQHGLITTGSQCDGKSLMDLGFDGIGNKNSMELINNRNRNAGVQCDKVIWNQFICEQVEAYQRAFQHVLITTGFQCDGKSLMDLVFDGIQNKKADSRNSVGLVASPGGDSSKSEFEVYNAVSCQKLHTNPIDQEFFEHTLELGANVSEAFSPTVSGNPSQTQTVPTTTSYSSVTREIFHTKRDFIKDQSLISICEQPIETDKYKVAKPSFPNQNAAVNELNEEQYSPDISQIQAKLSVSETNLSNLIARVKLSFTEFSKETLGENAGPASQPNEIAIRAQKSHSDTAISLKGEISSSPKSIQLFCGKSEEDEFLKAEVKKLSKELLAEKELNLEGQIPKTRSDQKTLGIVETNSPSKLRLSRHDIPSHCRSNNSSHCITRKRTSKIPKLVKAPISTKNLQLKRRGKKLIESRIPIRKQSQSMWLDLKEVVGKSKPLTTAKLAKHSRIPVLTPPLTRSHSPIAFPKPRSCANEMEKQLFRMLANPPRNLSPTPFPNPKFEQFEASNVPVFASHLPKSTRSPSSILPPRTASRFEKNTERPIPSKIQSNLSRSPSPASPRDHGYKFDSKSGIPVAKSADEKAPFTNSQNAQTNDNPRPINPVLQSSLFPSNGPVFLRTEYQEKYYKTPSSQAPLIPAPSRRAANFSYNPSQHNTSK